MIPRYRDHRITKIWSEHNRNQIWFNIELENIRRVAGQDAANMLLRVGPPTLGLVRGFELRTGHEVIGFVRALDSRIRKMSEIIGGPVKAHVLLQWLHFGLTSSDLVDTAMAMQIQRTQTLLVRTARTVDFDMEGWLDQLGDSTRVARTHGQLASVVPATHHWSVLWQMFRRARNAFCHREVPAKMSGPVGTHPEGNVGMEEALGVTPAPEATQIVPRDYLNNWVKDLVSMLDVCEAIATQIWLQAQEGIAEVREGHGGKVSSSAMPHKRNPVLSENIRGLCRIARGYAQMLQPSVIQWGEHDLAHSSVERVALPDLCHTAMKILERTSLLLSGMEPVYGPADEFVDTHPQLRELQRSGMTYVDAYDQLAAYPGGKIPETTNTPGEDTGQ